ncbi:MAG: hypothetical protein M1818_001984 [Claussenomyces sp. TS43310]|nr:MAG: hypothetical protein M1818_001984 [Claussenomyces sp. TS43310]
MVHIRLSDLPLVFSLCLALHAGVSSGHPAASTSSNASTTSAAPTSTSSSAPLTPNGKKSGSAGGDAYPFWEDHLGWWYDWSADPSQPGSPIGVPMLWGDGHVDETDASRLAAFKNITTTPQYVMGFYEPDCSTAGSSDVSVDTAVELWEELIAPWGDKGTLLGSPSMCKQADETWLAEFKTKITHDWDFTTIHISKTNMTGANKDIDHYWDTYGKPIWVTEFACVDDVDGWNPCTDQSEIDGYINDIVDLLEADSRIYAYAYTAGEGLGDVWPPVENGELTESGQTYLTDIEKYYP